MRGLSSSTRMANMPERSLIAETNCGCFAFRLLQGANGRSMCRRGFGAGMNGLPSLMRSLGAQRPLLMQGLRELKAGQTEGVPREAMIRRYLGSYSIRISAMLSAGTQAFAGAHRPA